MNEFFEVIIDTALDVLRQLPFLFVVFLFLEFVEHKMSERQYSLLTKAGRFGPVIGGLLGAVPQCGFSTVVSNMYATGIATVGTLFAVFLSTSDEMIIIMLSESGFRTKGLIILGIKALIGIIIGLVIDIVVGSNKKQRTGIHDFCEHEHCHCENGILKPALIHTLKIAGFIAAVTLVLNIIMHYFGEEAISKLVLSGSPFSSFIASLIGLIPNCASSVLLTEMYISGALSFGSCLGGLLAGCGIGFLVLFKVNKNLKNNLIILLTTYLIGSVIGLAVNLLGISL